jgi:hypothetical protein
VLLSYPNDLDALGAISMTMWARNSSLGRSPEEAEPFVEKIVELAEDDRFALVLLGYIALEARNNARADSIFEALRARPDFDPDRREAAVWPEFVIVRDRPKDDTSWTYTGIDRMSVQDFEDLVGQLANLAEDLDGARLVAEAVIESGIHDQSPYFRGIQIWEAWIAAAQGRFRDRDRLLATMDFTDGGHGKVPRALTFALPMYPASDSLLFAIESEVVNWDTLSSPILGPSGQKIQGPLDHAAVKDYLRALLAIRLGHDERVREFKSRLAAKADSTSRLDFEYAFLRSIEAMEALRVDRFEDALAAVHDARLILPRQWYVSSLRTQSLNRFIMGEALAGLGRYEEAVDAYRSLAVNFWQGLVYRGPSYIRLAEVHERLGNIDEAINYYERLMVLWKDCDPELVPMREAARQELNRLKSI